jgi:hypothetical protein
MLKKHYKARTCYFQSRGSNGLARSFSIPEEFRLSHESLLLDQSYERKQRFIICGIIFQTIEQSI